jgi:uncharacterized membrane protein YkoI
MNKKWTISGATVALVAVAAVTGVLTVGAQSNGDDSEPPITGEALERASEAALAHTGGGRVTETEMGDEESYYEVEVTLDDGTQIDVQLDEDFNVVGDEEDLEDEEEEGDDDD